jgi:hypothetical protein
LTFRFVRVDSEAVEIQGFVADPRPFGALYEHWERHQWSPFAIDFSVDPGTLDRSPRHWRSVRLEV